MLHSFHTPNFQAVQIKDGTNALLRVTACKYIVDDLVSNVDTALTPKTIDFRLQLQRLTEVKFFYGERGKNMEADILAKDARENLNILNHLCNITVPLDICTNSLAKDNTTSSREDIPQDWSVALCSVEQSLDRLNCDIETKFKDKSSQLITQEPEEEMLINEACNNVSELLLKASLNYIVEHSKARMIMENTSMHNPYHKNFSSLLVQNFLHNVDVSLNLLQDLDNVNEWLDEVQELARRNFDMAHTAYKNEIQQISKWGNEVNLDKELHFARIEPFKWCMWSMGILPGLDMSEERLELAKVISFIYVIDDIFDAYGTYDELCLFTEAINRWESADVTQLPNCMKVCFKALLKTTNDFCSKFQTKHGWNPEQFLRKLWAEQCNAYFIELRWSVDKYSPSPKEYLNNGIVSSGTHVVLAHAFFLMGTEISKRSLEELNSLPSIISSTATILRLWNDAGNHMDRTPNGEDGSYVDWYMKEHKISSYDIARKHVSQKISDAWKCLNKEYMSSTSPFSKDFKEAWLNLARLVPIMYSQDESHHLQFMVEP
ncbi:(3S,6E)-nerolidol synthase 1-like [Chenopodium quinoa]|uniref:(3S,6E)-nerolidol synthase 1-like n=1 Tax=Chenopodium quinoa TaxID=63459 RepID=UPI000B774704|nr:(3S,6E)-nerolidol synthase 1-like [Chenopodium quinoa]